ncbi:MAG: hypothetical protein QW228_08630 [Candidatus Aenigmatarchaeota archaeon]
MLLPQLIYDQTEKAFFWGLRGEKAVGFHYRVMKGEKYRVKLVGEKNWRTVDLQEFVMMLRNTTLEIMALQA